MSAITGIPFTLTAAEDGGWTATVTLWEGAAAIGSGPAPMAAVLDCAAALKLMCEHLAVTLPGEAGQAVNR